MTKPDLTALGLLIDRSGSMQSIKEDAEGAIAAFIESQGKEPGECTVRLADFDTEYRQVYSSTPIAQVRPYVLEPRGMTALLDSVVRFVSEFGHELAALPEHERPSKVIVVIQTDGLENSSKEVTIHDVNAVVTRQREIYSWEFLYLGANQDAITVGSAMGVPRDSSITYVANPAGTANVAAAASAYVGRLRQGAPGAFTDAERNSAV